VGALSRGVPALGRRIVTEGMIRWIFLVAGLFLIGLGLIFLVRTPAAVVKT
jgi:hypothetical protein